MAKRKHTPTAAMKSAAARGLRLAKEKSDSVDTDTLSIGRKIASGSQLSDDHVEAIANYHAGAEGVPDDAGHLLMGGLAGAHWSAARTAAMDISALSEDTSTVALDDPDKDINLEVFVRDNLGEETQVEDGVMWAPILRSGMLAMRPGPGGEKKADPLVFVPGYATDAKKEIGLQNLVDSFDAGAIQHVTIPTTHENTVLENTGFIKGLKIVDSKKRPGEKVLVAAHDIRDPEVKRKMTLGTIANRSCGIVYDYVNTESGRSFDQAIDHVALTNKPWVTGMTPYGDIHSEDDFSNREVVPMLLSEKSIVGPVVEAEDAPVVTRTGDNIGNHEQDKFHFADNVVWPSTALTLNSMRDQVQAQLDTYRHPDEFYPYWSVADLKADAALVCCEYGDPDGVNDKWVVPLEVDGDKVSLSDYAKWTPVQKEWVVDEDAAQDKEEVARLIGNNTANLSEDSRLYLSVSQAKRDRAKKNGHALPDGSYPIENEKDLRDAATLAASGHGNVSAAKALIRRRAKDLGVDVESLPGFGKKSKSTSKSSSKTNMSQPVTRSKGGAMKPSMKEVLERLGLTEEQVKALTPFASENESLRTDLAETQRTARQERVAARVKELQGMKLTPGFCKIYEEIALGDDGDAAASLNLSDEAGRKTGEKDYTVTELAERLIGALAKDESGKLALAEHDLTTSSVGERPPLNAEHQAQQEEKDGKRGPLNMSGDEWLADAEKVAPGVTTGLALAEKKEG